MKLLRILSLMFLFNVSSLPQAAELKPYTGEMQPTDFILKDMKGVTHQLSQYENNVILINFWATWCPPCIEELPSLQRLQQLFKGKAFKILTIDIGEPAELIQPFLEEVEATDLTVLLDRQGKSHQEWNIYVFPTNFLLDRAGNIRYAAVGALNWDEPAIIDMIDLLLK
jgi:thiol-disulfide isomerase/thioredoxin